MSRATERPAPPIIGKVTDTSIQLYWNALPGHPRYCIQEFDTAKSTDWGNVYSGIAVDTTIINLEPQNVYRFRMRAVYDDESTQWSPVVSVTTTRKAISGEDLHKAINSKDVAHVREILDIGTVHVDVPDKLGFSPLMNACQKGHARVVEELLKRGADVGFANGSGKTSLMVAAFQGHTAVLELLIREHADINQRDRGGQDALHAAVAGEHADAVEYLISAGADVNSTDAISGWTPLIRNASCGGNVAVAKVLLQHGAKPNARDKHGKTALMLAAVGGHEELARTLLANGADPDVKTEHGGLASEFAVGFGHQALASMLKAAHSK